MIFALVIILVLIAVQFNPELPGFQDGLCTGHSDKFIEHFAMHSKSENEMIVGEAALKAIFAIAGLVTTAKFVIYLFIYKKMYLRNRQTNLGLDAQIIQKRRVKNVLTFSGEATAAIIGLVLLLLQRIIVSKTDLALFIPESQGIYNILCYQVIAACNLISSPEMMRFLFSLDL